MPGLLSFHLPPPSTLSLLSPYSSPSSAFLLRGLFWLSFYLLPASLSALLSAVAIVAAADIARQSANRKTPTRPLQRPPITPIKPIFIRRLLTLLTDSVCVCVCEAGIEMGSSCDRQHNDSGVCGATGCSLLFLLPSPPFMKSNIKIIFTNAFVFVPYSLVPFPHFPFPFSPFLFAFSFRFQFSLPFIFLPLLPPSLPFYYLRPAENYIACGFACAGCSSKSKRVKCT